MGMANTLCPYLQMEVHYPSKNPSGCMPMLNLEVNYKWYKTRPWWGLDIRSLKGMEGELRIRPSVGGDRFTSLGEIKMDKLINVGLYQYFLLYFVDLSYRAGSR